MTKQNILGAMKFVALVLVMLCVSIMFVACGKGDSKGSKEAKQQAQMREVFNSAIEKTVAYSGSYTVVQLQESEESYLDENDEEKTEKDTQRSVYSFNSDTNDYVNIDDYDNDNVVDEAKYYTKSGANSILYSFVKSTGSGVSDTYTSTKISADHTKVQYSFAKYLNEESFLTILKTMQNADNIKAFFIELGLEDSIIDENATYEMKFAKSFNKYSVNMIYNGIIFGNYDENDGVVEKTITNGKMNFYVEFDENGISKIRNQLEALTSVAVTGNKTQDVKSLIVAECVVTKNYDASLMPTDFSSYPTYDEAVSLRNRVTFNIGDASRSRIAEFGENIEQVYESLNLDINSILGEGLTTDGKWYSDEGCTKEVNLATTLMPSYDNELYVKVLPKDGFALIKGVLCEKRGGLLEENCTYIGVDASKTTVFDFSDDYKMLGKMFGEKSIKLYVDDKLIVGKSFPIVAGKTYNLLVEIELSCVTNFKLATKEQNEMFQKAIKSIELLQTRETSFTISLTNPISSDKIETHNCAFDKTTSRIVDEKLAMVEGEEPTNYLKQQIEKVGENYNIYQKMSQDGTFTKTTQSESMFAGIDWVTEEFPKIGEALTLSTYLNRFALGRYTDGNTGAYVGYEIAMTKDTLKITINFVNTVYDLEYKFSGEKLVSIIGKQTITREYSNMTQISKIDISYNYDSTMWEDVSNV